MVAPLDAEVHVDPVGPGERVGEAGRGGHAGHRVGRLPQHIDGMGHAVLGDLDAEIRHARERVVPGVSLEARVALEQAPRTGDSRPLGGAPESLLILRLGIDRHDQRAGVDGRVGRGVAPVVDIGDAGAPGVELGRRHGKRDARLRGPLVVLEGHARLGIGRGHGAVNGETGCPAHLP